MPHRFSNAYTSGTEYRIDLKPGCKFKFVVCLETYLKKIGSIGPMSVPDGPFLDETSDF